MTEPQPRDHEEPVLAALSKLIASVVAAGPTMSDPMRARLGELGMALLSVAFPNLEWRARPQKKKRWSDKK